MKVMEVTMNTT
jgi:hypothetical protein